MSRTLSTEQQHRDIDAAGWARSVVYPATKAAMRGGLAEAGDADIVVKANGVGVFDRELLEGMVAQSRPGALANLLGCRRRRHARRDARRCQPPDGRQSPYDMVLTYGGGPPVVRCLSWLRRVACVPVYNALDPTTHFPVAPEARFASDLAFLGNRLPDREARVEECFLSPRRRCLSGVS